MAAISKNQSKQCFTYSRHKTLVRYSKKINLYLECANMSLKKTRIHKNHNASAIPEYNSLNKSGTKTVVCVCGGGGGGVNGFACLVAFKLCFFVGGDFLIVWSIIQVMA